MQAENVKKVAVIGAGILGHSIAQKFAAENCEVHLYDISQYALEQARCAARDALRDLERNGMLLITVEEAIANISYSTDFQKTVTGVDLVIEAVTEDLELKVSIIKQVEELVGDYVIIASNSSSFTPSEYAAFTKNKSRIIGAHFFNPPHLLPLVELIVGPDTDESIISEMYNFLMGINMVPVRVKKETPGFIGNRLQFALLSEAISLVEEGIATPEDIDKVVKYGFGRRLSVMGPFEVFDFGGWDTIAKVHPNITGKPLPATIGEKVQKGLFGVKSGQGFYAWDAVQVAEKRRLLSEVFVYLEKKASHLGGDHK